MQPSPPHVAPSMLHPDPSGGGAYRARAPLGAFGPLKSTTRWIFTGLISIMMVGFVTAIAMWSAALISAGPGGQPDDTMMGIGFAGFVTVVLLLYVQIAIGVVWLHKAWAWLPWDQRYTRHWRSWLTPGQVALMMLIPYFNYYWMFVANCGLCDALDRLRVSFPTSKPAPKTLAIAACACQLIVPFPVGAILWVVFMRRCEEMTKEMSAAMVPRLSGSY